MFKLIRYMDPYGTWTSGELSTLVTRVKQSMDKSEKPSRVDPRNYQLVNSIRVRKVQVYDPNLGLYQWDNFGDISYL